MTNNWHNTPLLKEKKKGQLNQMFERVTCHTPAYSGKLDVQASDDICYGIDKENLFENQ